MVRIALEDRIVPQNREIRLQSGGIKTSNRRSTGQPDIGLLRIKLENLLANHDQSHSTGGLPKLALTEIEIGLLDELLKDKPSNRPPKKTLSTYLEKIARLGGNLGRKGDSPPGNTVMWRGMSRLTDIALGFNLAVKLCG